MDAVPSLWRTELWHPLIVHIPLALLLVGTGMRLVGGLHRRFPSLQFLVPSGRLLLAIGTVAAWTAVYTGTLADAEVARSLCDPRVAETHEWWAFRVSALFTVGLLVDGTIWIVRGRAFLRRGLMVLLMGCLLAGSGGLIYVGHLGSSLVYQQGAAVYHPAPDCAAFE